MDIDQKWQVVIDSVLKFDTKNHDHMLDSKLALTCILMESATFRQYLSSSSMASLLQLLEIQVTDVLHERYIDDRAVAALNPILAVLYKSCVERHDSFAEIIRKKVFPDDISDCDYDEYLEQNESPKNMSPIDAPEGTLRWKLIQLLTWPNSFVKRLTGELLFILCHSKQQEFIRRVGIGNAVAILSLKGLIDLPAAVYS
jgi:Guanine nucleotide exchange factor synembryn